MNIRQPEASNRPVATIDLLMRGLSKRGYSIQISELGPTKKRFAHIKDSNGRYVLTCSAESPLYPFATASSRIICANKHMTYDFMQALGLSIPRTITVRDKKNGYSDAIKLMLDCGRVIIKPAKASLSNGLSLDVTSEDDLITAINKASEFDADVLVQQQFIGEEVRFVVCDGVVRAAILRQAPQVVGDGTRTIKQLIEAENIDRAAIKGVVVPYPELSEQMMLDDIDPNAIPNNGWVVKLGRGTMIMNGASIYNITNEINPSYLELAQAAGSAFGKGFVVIDMLIEDYKQESTSTNYVFLECNLTPALALFYSCRDGKNFDIVEEYLVPMIVAAIEGS